MRDAADDSKRDPRAEQQDAATEAIGIAQPAFVAEPIAVVRAIEPDLGADAKGRAGLPRAKFIAPGPGRITFCLGLLVVAADCPRAGVVVDAGGVPDALDLKEGPATCCRPEWPS